jgi:hypothetical protein
MFLQDNDGDHATKMSRFMPFICLLTEVVSQNFFIKLRNHLLPHIQELHQLHAELHPERYRLGLTSNVGRTSYSNHEVSKSVFLQNDWIYNHKLS